MAILEQVLVKPLLTEKLSKLSEKHNRYGFIVQKAANKNQIKQAVEKLFDVKVVKVNTSITPGKLRRRGRTVKKTSQTKRAYIQVASGQKIEFFKGV